MGAAGLQIEVPGDDGKGEKVKKEKTLDSLIFPPIICLFLSCLFFGEWGLRVGVFDEREK